MSTQILIKRSTTTGAVPTTSDIAVGELAINTVDKRIFTNNSGTIVELGTTPTTQAVTGNASVGGTFDVVGAVTVGNFTADGTVDLTSATVTIPAPTADTHPATKKYVDDEVNAILAGAPAALDTLNEIAAAINDDANLYTTLTDSIATKLSLAGGTMTGSIDMGANSVTTSVDPATANTLTRKSYVDGLYQSTVDAEVSAANALASEQAAATSASNAATSASASATSATASASSATNAASSATAAASSATSSANSATASATSATQSAASATQAQALVDSIESFYLGAEASAPTVDDNGDPLQAGDWYFNTTDNATYIYNGSSWQSVSPDVVADLTPQLGGNLDTNGNDINFGDNDKAIFGAGSDLQIYHSGTHSFITDSGTGSLFIGGDNETAITNASGTEYKVRTFSNGAVSLYYDNASKLATTSTGIDVTGTATMDGLTVDGDVSLTASGTERFAINREVSPDIQYKIATSNYHLALESVGTSQGDIKFATGTSSASDRMLISSNGDISFYEDTGTTAKFFWDASAERLGIGTSGPSESLHVASGNVKVGLAASFITYTEDYGIGTPNASGLQVFAANGDTIRLGHMTGGTTFTERMRIDSSGNLLVGTTSTSIASDTSGTGFLVEPASAPLQVKRETESAGQSVVVFNNTGVDGQIIDLRKDGAPVGSIGTYLGWGQTIYMGNGDTGIAFQSTDNNTISPHNPSTNAPLDASVSLGESDYRFKDLYLSGGVYLGGTGSANKLDDYESGTWTPTLSGSTGGSVSGVGTYTKTGNVVTVTIRIENQPTSGLSGSMLLNLPFSSSSSTGEQVVPINMHVGWSISGKMVGTFSNASTGFLRQMTDSAGWSVLGATGGNVYIRTVFTYTTD
jgi:hypothetical protein